MSEYKFLKMGVHVSLNGPISYKQIYYTDVYPEDIFQINLHFINQGHTSIL
jgi:hypothetical protein